MASSGIPYVELRLDPGPKPRRRSSLNWKCISLSFIAITVLLVAFLVFKIVRITLMPEDVGTQAQMFQDLTVPYSPSQVVRPLVDSNQTFDIMVTVWQRQNESQATIEGGPILSERAIYSNTIFRRVRLEDKNLKTAVQLRISTKVFKSPELWSYDLRASFVLIPTSPSPLDYAVNYSSWVPNEINLPPMRLYPEGSPPSLTDRIIDSYGAFLPLLTFDAIESGCASPPDPNLEQSDDINDESDEIYDLKDSNQVKIKSVKHQFMRYISTRKKPVLDVHPYIITRSYLRVVDMTRIFNRTEYEKKHNKLRSTSCGMDMNGRLDWRLCWKHLDSNQNIESRIKLRKKDPETGKNTTEWAYSPYLSLSDTAWGPFDRVKVPVNREVCPGQETALGNGTGINEREFVNIMWNIAFSGNTASKIELEDRLGLATSVYNAKADTNEERVKAQTNLDFINGLTGHRTKEDVHIRRHILLAGISLVISTIANFLDLYYWFSQASTVGISAPGTILFASATLLDIVIQVVKDSKSHTSFGVGWVLRVIMSRIMTALTVFFMYKAALRAELHWYARWIPGLRIAKATHLERASARLESKISWMYKVTLFAVIAFVSTYYPDLLFLASGNKARIGGTKIVKDLSSKAGTLLVAPSLILGRGLQIALNYHGKTFSGMYRITAFLGILLNLCITAMVLPHVVGNLPSANGVSVYNIVNLMYAIVLTWQALRYAAVVTQEEDEGEK